MRPTPESSASDLRLSASTTVRSRVTGAGRRSSNAETSAVPIPRPCQSSATVTAMSAVAGSSGYCRRWATPTGPSSPSGGSTISTRAICSAPSTLSNKPPDHRVIKFTEHLQKPVLARFARQTAEPVAQHLGIRRQQRPDQRRRAVRQKKLSGQHLAAQLSRSHTTRCRSAPCRLHQIASFLAFPIPKDQPLFCFATCGFRQRHILVNTPQRPPVHLRAPASSLHTATSAWNLEGFPLYTVNIHLPAAMVTAGQGGRHPGVPWRASRSAVSTLDRVPMPDDLLGAKPTGDLLLGS